MKDLVMEIAKALVDSPDQVRVEEEFDGDEIILKLSVAPDDMGKVIGKQGRIAKAIRTLLKSVSIKDKTKVTLEII